MPPLESLAATIIAPYVDAETTWVVRHHGVFQGYHYWHKIGFDRNARERAGVMPQGIQFTPVARSTTQFSNMMVVRGDGFEVFIDYTFTTLDLTAFESLPALETVLLSIQCLAPWCG